MGRWGWLLFVCVLTTKVIAAPTLATLEAQYFAEYKQGQVSKLELPKATWKKLLSRQAFRIMWRRGTEKPFSGEYDKHYQPGVYACASCSQFLYSSSTKYDSKTGWPSFWQPIHATAITETPDHSIFWMPRTETVCSRCGAHLGHVFKDGPPPTGLRYCMNSLALKFFTSEYLERAGISIK